MRFANKTVLVTGGSRGLGQAIALAFGAEGAHVWVGYAKRAADAEATAAKIASARAVQLDVTDGRALAATIDQLAEERGGIDIAVNAAGVMRNKLFALSDAADWQEPLRTNLEGALALSHAVLRPMLRAGGGAIIHVGSVAGMRASPGQAGYSASKGGLVALTRTLAVELAPRGIRVNAVVPGMCDAGMAQRIDRNAVDEFRRRIPLGRLGTGDDVAQVALFLASPAASYIVGQAIVVDGGLSA
ncbi:MAG: SDR family oxidoreductase [Kofleriaceae bacterium]